MTRKGAIARNVALVSMASYLEAAVGLATGVIIARTLGPEEYGHYAFLVWLCGLLLLLSNNGLTTSSLKFIAEARGSGDTALAAAIAARLRRVQTVCSAIVVAAFVAFSVALPHDRWNELRVVVVPIAIVAVWARAGFWMLGAIGKGYERFVPENGTLMVNAIANLALVGAFAAFGADTIAFFLLYAALGVLMNLVVRVLLARSRVRIASGPIPADYSRRMKRHLLETGALTGLNIATLRTVEMSMLKVFADATAISHFAIASSLTKGAVDVLAGGISAVLLPAMSRSFGHGGVDSLRSMISESTRYFWFAGMAIAGGGLVVAEPLIRTLYGPRFEAAAPVLMAQLVAAGLTVVNGGAAASLTSSDRQRDRIVIGVIGLVFNLLAGYVLVPRYGALGAAMSFGLTQTLESVLAFTAARRIIAFRFPLSAMIRLALAAAIAAATGRWVGGQVDGIPGLFAAGVAFAAIYLSASVVLRAWKATDYDLIASIVARAGWIGGRAAVALAWTKQRFSTPSHGSGPADDPDTTTLR